MTAIPLTSPSISEADIDTVVGVLRSGMLVQGEHVTALERDVAKYLDIRNVVAVSNGTATLHLALLSLGIGPGDEVIVPAFSYVATANVVEIVGARCVFVDVEADSCNIDIAKVPEAVTDRTRAMIPVHEFGLACDISPLVDLAAANNIPIIEDAACALGTTRDNRLVGTFGRVGSFSLHPRKAVTSGEGGLLVTDDDALAEQFRIMRNHGIQMRDERMHFVAAGFNYRMTDFQAALVRGQFARLDEILDRRNELADIYFDALAGAQNITLPVRPRDARHTWQTFHVMLAEEIDRDSMIDLLKDRGIGTNYGAQCIPAQDYYQKNYASDSREMFPNAWRAYRQGLALPMYANLSATEARQVAHTFRALIERGK